MLCLAWTGTAAAQQRTVSNAAPIPLSASQGDPHPVTRWLLPDGGGAKSVDVFRRRQYVGEEERIQPWWAFSIKRDTVVLTVIDTTLKVQGILEYRVQVTDTLGRTGPTSPWAMAHNFPPGQRPYAYGITARDEAAARSIRLSWRTDRIARARALRVFRAKDYDGPYHVVVELPPTDTAWTDHVDRVKEALWYRVQVIDVFGPGAISVPVLALSDHAPACIPPELLRATPATAGITLHWRPRGTDIMGFVVQRKAAGNDPWRDASGLLFGDTISHWTDEAAPAGLLQAWRVMAVSTGDQRSEGSDFILAARPVLEAPPMPDDPVARRQDPGRVLISWRPPLLSKAVIAGFKVERSSDGGGTFITLNSALVEAGDERFLDSTAADGPLAYRVRSVDPSGAIGEPSRTVTVEGLSPQTTPRMVIARRTPQGIALEWPQADRAVKALRVYRTDGIAEPRKLRELPPSASGWLDELPVKGAMQFYLVRAVLQDGSEGDVSQAVGVRW